MTSENPQLFKPLLGFGYNLRATIHILGSRSNGELASQWLKYQPKPSPNLIDYGYKDRENGLKSTSRIPQETTGGGSNYEESFFIQKKNHLNSSTLPLVLTLEEWL